MLAYACCIGLQVFVSKWQAEGRRNFIQLINYGVNKWAVVLKPPHGDSLDCWDSSRRESQRHKKDQSMSDQIFCRLFTIHFPLLTKSLNLYGQYNNGQVLLYPSICCHGWNLYDGEVFGERVRGREEGQG